MGYESARDSARTGLKADPIRRFANHRFKGTSMAANDDDQKPDTKDDDHSLDMSQAAVKRMIAEGRERGFITYDQLNAVLPPEQVSSDQIEDVMSMLSEMDIRGL